MSEHKLEKQRTYLNYIDYMLLIIHKDITILKIIVLILQIVASFSCSKLNNDII